LALANLDRLLVVVLIVFIVAVPTAGRFIVAILIPIFVAILADRATLPELRRAVVVHVAVEVALLEAGIALELLIAAIELLGTVVVERLPAGLIALRAGFVSIIESTGAHIAPIVDSHALTGHLPQLRLELGNLPLQTIDPFEDRFLLAPAILQVVPIGLLPAIGLSSRLGILGLGPLIVLAVAVLLCVARILLLRPAGVLLPAGILSAGVELGSSGGLRALILCPLILPLLAGLGARVILGTKLRAVLLRAVLLSAILLAVLLLRAGLSAGPVLNASLVDLPGLPLCERGGCACKQDRRAGDNPAGQKPHAILHKRIPQMENGGNETLRSSASSRRAASGRFTLERGGKHNPLQCRVRRAPAHR
jgi:hypothetical protein